jgi:CO/xanthine dehydrogenase Mo-binding subunit
VVLHRPEGEGLLQLRSESSDYERCFAELLRNEQTKAKKEEMKQNEQHENYGLYITQNTYTMDFYCFHRDAAEAYWSGELCKKAVGKTSQEALSNYKNGVYTNK